LDIALDNLLRKKKIGICLYEMDGVDKILSGYYLTIILLMIWSVIGIITAMMDGMRSAQLRAENNRTISLQQPILPEHNDNKALQHDVSRNDGDEEDPMMENNSRQSGLNNNNCCYGHFVRPTIALIILHTALFSYSSIVKTTMSLLQCRPSPIDSGQMIMYSSGAITCYNHWYSLNSTKTIMRLNL
jgi:hypothetical protein